MLGDFLVTAKKAKAKTQALPTPKLGPSSDVGLAHRAPPPPPPHSDGRADQGLQEGMRSALQSARSPAEGPVH